MFRCSSKMVISVNQLSLYGAVAYLTKELLKDQRAPGKPGALDQMEQEIITQPPLAEVQANEERQGNLLQNYERKFGKKKNYQQTRSYPHCAPKQVWIRSKLDNYSMLFRHWMERRIDLFAETTRYLDMKRKIVQKGGSKAMHDWALSRTKKFAKHTEDTALKLFHLYSKTEPLLGLELWTVLKSVSERQCRSKKKKELRGNPLQRRDQYWNRHWQAMELCSDGTEKMDRHWSAKIQGPLLLPDVKIHDSITSTKGSWSRSRCRSSLW